MEAHLKTGLVRRKVEFGRLKAYTAEVRVIGPPSLEEDKRVGTREFRNNKASKMVPAEEDKRELRSIPMPGRKWASVPRTNKRPELTHILPENMLKNIIKQREMD